MKIERYILTSRNDSSVNSFETKCFQKHADAYICMLTEALETVRKSSNCKDGEVHVDPMSNASVLSFKYKGVTYEWSIDWQAIELDTRELNCASREVERELEKQNITVNYASREFERELENQNITGGEKNFENYETIRERLFIRVCNYEANKELLSGVPHEKIEDLAITYHAMVDISQDGEFASAIINNSMMEAFRISHRQLREDAMASSPHVAPAKVEPLQNVVGELLDANMDDVDDPKQDMSMLVVTNVFGINGASVLFYPDMMDRLADEMHGSFYVLPSSIHEVIVIPASSETDGEQLNAMIREINAGCVRPADRLSNNAYIYDVNSKTLRMVGGEF